MINRIFSLSGYVLVLAFPIGLGAADTRPSADSLLGLPRLAGSTAADRPSRLSRSKVTSLDLAAAPASDAATARSSHGVNYYIIKPNREWRKGVRNVAGPAFVSFFLYASENTRVDVAGAVLTISRKKGADIAQILCGPEKFPLAAFGGVRLERHEDALFADLPVLTIRLDRGSGTWDLFAFRRLVATGLPLAVPGSDKIDFSITGGSSGAWLLGWVNSDEHPLFDDANRNGIDDLFERSRTGAILATSAPATDVRTLARQWMESQRATPPSGWSVRRPLPSALP